MFSANSVISFLLLGFIFGLRHAFDADHIAAVSCLSVDTTTRIDVIRRGIYWALGHSVTLVILALGYHVIDRTLPLGFTLIFEKIAALILVLLGLYSFFVFIRSRKVIESNVVHSHPPLGTHIHLRSSFLIGVLHGAVGSTAILLVTLGVLKSVIFSLLYIGALSIGITVGMIITCAVLAISLQYIRSYTTLLTGLFSFIIGASMLL